MKHSTKFFKAVAAAGTILFLLFAPSSATAQFNEHFNSPTLDPAWQMVAYTGPFPRAHGFTNPANDLSLVANPGLAGETFDGQAIEGTDAVQMVEGSANKSVALQNETGIPEGYALYQNHPNPFNPETEIRFQLPEANHVVVKIFNTVGEEIRTLVDAPYEAGYHRVRWDGKANNGKLVASGVYLYQLRAGNFSQVKKMSLLR